MNGHIAHDQDRSENKVENYPELLVVAVCLILLCFLFYQPGFMPGYTLFNGDAIKIDHVWEHHFPGLSVPKSMISDPVWQFFPWSVFSRTMIRQGIIPLWNHNSSCGSPFMANYQSGVFNPYNVFFIVLPYGLALKIKLICLLLTAGMGMYLLLRSFELNQSGSLTGAVIFTFNGFAVSWLQYPIFNLVALLPFILLSLETLLRGWQKRAFLASVSLFTLTLVAGNPEILFQEMCLIMIYVAVRLFHYGWRAWPAVLLSCAAFILACLISSVQLFSFLEYLQESYRLAMRQTGLESGYLFKPEFILLLFLPKVLVTRQLETSYFMGTLSLLLALIALIKYRKWNSLMAFLAIGLFSLAIPFNFGAAHDLISMIPGFEVSLNHRILFGLALAVGFLAAAGLHVLSESSRRSTQRLFALRSDPLQILSIGLVLLMLYLFLFHTFWYLKPIAKMLSLSAYTQQITTLLIFWGLGLLAAVTVTSTRSDRRNRFILLFFPLVIFLELYLVYHSLNIACRSDNLLPPSKTVPFLQQSLGNERFIGHFHTLRPNLSMCYNLNDIRGYDALENKYYYTLLSFFNPEITKNPVQPWNRPHWKILDLLSVRYTLSDKSMMPQQHFYRLVHHFHNGEVWVHERTGYLPRASFYRSVISETELASIKDFFDQEMYRTHVLVEENATAQRPIQSLLSVNPDKDRHQSFSLHAFLERPNRVRVEYSAADDGIMVVNNAFHQGWKALVDGEIREVFRANFAFQGVRVQAGNHIVELIFAPWSYQLGLFLSLLGLFSFVILSFSLKPSAKS
ncbi:YfhO family protein [bacterium]|nr:YfhO family protein [bacterium]